MRVLDTHMLAFDTHVRVFDMHVRVKDTHMRVLDTIRPISCGVHERTCHHPTLDPRKVNKS